MIRVCRVSQIKDRKAVSPQPIRIDFLVAESSIFAYTDITTNYFK